MQSPAASVVGGAQYALEVPPPVPAEATPEPIPLNILYEDEAVLVLDKPAGLVVHPAPGNWTGTLVNALIAHCGASLRGIGGESRPGIVHRLDKDTSGVMVVAKTEAAHARLAADFAEHRQERRYLALCWGIPNPSTGEIIAAIGRDPRNRKRMAVRSNNGKPAITRYRTLRSWGQAASLLECQLATGRTHQIRVHLCHWGHPLVGDPVYLRRIPGPARTLPDPVRDSLLDFPRQALHAASLGFRHPETGETLRFEAPTPMDFQVLIDQLEAAVAIH